MALTSTCRTAQVVFVDNVCDTVGRAVCADARAGGIRLKLFMELRANHPEHFWTLLALAGLESVQVGVEAIASPLLNAIGKGTRVMHNLATQ